MKGIILATLATVLSFLLATSLFRLWHIERRAYALLWVFAIGAGFVITAHFVTPDDLAILPLSLTAQPQWFDLVSSLFFFGAAFFGGILQIYNLADRGFSLRLLIDLEETSAHSATAGFLFGRYSAGHGIDWMYRKRLDGMIRTKLITIDGDVVELTARGTAMAKIFMALRQVFRVKAE